MPKPTWRRRKVLVYPRFQLLLVLVNSVALTLIGGFLILEFCRFVNSFHELGVKAYFPGEHAYFRVLQMQQLQFYSDMFLFFLFVLALSVVATLLISHRAAGPMVRMREYFRQLAEGKDVGPLTFRKADFFQDVPPVINEVLRKREER